MPTCAPSWLHIEEKLAEEGVYGSKAKILPVAVRRVRKDDPNRAYKVLVADLVGLKFDANGNPDYSAVKAHVAGQGWHLA